MLITVMFFAEYEPNSLSYNQKIVNKSNVAETLTKVLLAESFKLNILVK